MKEKVKQKRNVLAWLDSSISGTGFGVVAKHILGALHDSERYQIDHLAINFNGDFVDKSIVPWEVQSSRLLDPADPHGMKMFFRTLLKKDYDIVFVCNDLFVTTQVAEAITKIKEKSKAKGVKPPIFIYYYPVDCKVKIEGSKFLDVVDIPICYTDHGREETLKVKPELEHRLLQVPHGVDNKSFYRQTQKERAMWKHQYLGVSPMTTVVVSVNRNTERKQIPYSIMAFKKFREHVPDSIMYIHASPKDQGANLLEVLKDLKLDVRTDVIFPARYSPAHPAPVEILNRLYNMGDIFLTTHLGEGWSLTTTEALATGIPVIAPDNTCMREQLGENGERGYLYPCNDWSWIDNSGFRKKGYLNEIVNQMVKAYNDNRINPINPKTILACEWALKHDWKDVGNRFVKIFDEAENFSFNSEFLAEEI